MHSDLKNPTTLRGYVQIDQYKTQSLTAPAGWTSKQIALTYPNGSPILVSKVDAQGKLVYVNGVLQKVQAYAVDKPHYLGPAIVATKGKAVRMKFHNLLPVGRWDGTNRNGDLFIPVDLTLAGAGVGPNGVTTYSQNRAEVHLHGGDTPWISDGTPHQWLTPAGEQDTTNPKSLASELAKTGYNVATDPMNYLKGASQQNVPDMPDPGPGAGTYYFPNNQAGRLMFYHDHTFGLTRLNVYAGEAAPYLLTDPDQEAIFTDPNTGALVGVDTIPLVIQDKTFVPADIKLQDGLWNNTNTKHPKDGVFSPATTKAIWGGESDMWYPHVYEINQDPDNGTDGTNAVGRWDWGPYFWPVFPSLYDIPSGAVDDVTITPEAWMDTPLVNGVAYPSLDVSPKAYRFKILNAANDRMFNLSMFVADATVSRVDIINGGSGYDRMNPPAVTFDAPPAGAANGITATGTAIVNLAGEVIGVEITNPGVGYGLSPNITIAAPSNGTQATAKAIAGTEIKMVDAVPPTSGRYPSCAVDANGIEAMPSPSNQCWPSTWPTDGRDGGVPDPATSGPAWLQIGSEGGLLPQVATIPAAPMGYEYNRRSVTVLNTFTYGLFMGNAERADVVVDFSAYKGKTLIIYNDSPAPVPAFDPRNDHWTGKADESGAGSVENVRPGYGPNTRTIMQINVADTPAAPALNVTKLEANLEAAYRATQEPPIVGQSYYNNALGTSFTDAPNPVTGQKAFANIFTGSLQEPAFHFQPGDSAGVFSSVKVDNGGADYIKAPAVTLSAPAAGGVQATAEASLRISKVTMTNTGEGYLLPPLVSFTNRPTTANATTQALGSGAAGFASLGAVRVVVDGATKTTDAATFLRFAKLANPNATTRNTRAGSKTSVAIPLSYATVEFASPNNPSTSKGGVQALGHLVVTETATAPAGRAGTNTIPTFTYTFDVVVDVQGTGYNSPPTLTITSLPQANSANNVPDLMAHSVAGVTNVFLTSPNPRKPELAGGAGYNDLSLVTVGFQTATGAAPTVAAAAKVSGSVFDVTLVNTGSGYTTAPTVTLAASPTNTTATNATASASQLGSYLVKSKAIQELFDPTFGRMNATLGIELPFTSALAQTTIPLGYVDPVTEQFEDGETQIWKITHNGVDSHPVHFHLVNVQVINRIGWDGTVKPPQPNEYGWKETIKFHPLEDLVVALRAKKPKIGYDWAQKKELPGSAFGLPNSIRLRDPSQPEGVANGFTQINTVTGLPETIVNSKDDYGWEYVWHCHILGHEENDFMRAVKFNANEKVPAAPTNLAASTSANSATLTWTDNAVSEYRYEVSRAPDFTPAGPVKLLANATTFTDTSFNSSNGYTYTVTAVGAAGTSKTSLNVGTPPAPPVIAPTAPSNIVATLTNPGTAGSLVERVALTWTAPATGTAPNYVIKSGPSNTGPWTQVATAAAGATSATFNVPRNANNQPTIRYWFQVTATNAAGSAAAVTTQSARTN